MFDYGDIPEKDPYFKECLEREFFPDSQYEKYVKVKDGDVVVDIGASIGPFLYSISDRNLSNVIAVEPIHSYHNLLIKNSGLPNLKLYRNAIGVNDNEILDLEWSSEREQVKTISFKTIIEENNLTHIDFLKLDCEGGEYSIFTEQNIDYLKNNVGYIVGEFHLNDFQMKHEFKKLYNLLTKHNFNFRIESVDGYDNTQWFKDDLEYVSNLKNQVIIYIDNRKMKKLLCIAPHLSTGGLPQYLTKKVELLKDEYEIHLVEWQDVTGGRLIVTKNKIRALVPAERFYTLSEDKMELMDLINKINPDIIHCEEIPEFFMENKVAQALYSTDRTYKIVETSHDSSFDTEQKRFFPDKFMFVSNWQIDQYKDIDIPKVLVEYPIEYIDRPDRTEALMRLGLDPNKKHVLHIGLFTPRKNQAEFFEYAKMLPDVEFHCVGNQADNFKWYWEPLMQDKPSNVTWWNERTDVDSFYQSMDLFLFTSRGTNNDKETMPLVIREALSYQIPQLLYNLEVYQNYFDKYDSVNYLKFDDAEYNKTLIEKHLNNTQEIDPSKEAYVVCTYPVTDAIVQTTKDCINSLKRDGRKIIISAHAPVPKELQEMVDFVFYDSNNILTKHTFYSSFSFYGGDYDTFINLKGEDNDRYHGPACYTSFFNPATFAKSLGIEKLHYINYDYILKDEDYINYISQILNKKDTFFGEFTAQEGKCYYTYFFSARPEAMMDVMPTILDDTQYNKLMISCGSESNGIENMFYHLFKGYPNNHIEPRDKFESDAEKYFDFEDYSMVEYYTILPTNIPGRFCPWVTISNAKESKLIHYTVERNGELIIDRNLEVTGKYYFWDMVPYSLDDNTIVKFYITDLNTGDFIKEHTFVLDKDYFLNKMPNNGNFKWKADASHYAQKPKVKLMHLVTEPETNEKEKRSVENVKEFCELTGIEYEQRVNVIYKDVPPKDNCARPDDVQDKPGYYKLAPGHYGCYLAHKNAMLAENNDDYDYVLIFEGDVIIDTPYSELYSKLIEFNQTAIKTDMDIIGFGNPTKDRNLNGPKIDDIHTDVTPFVPAQSYLITRSKLDRIRDKVNNTPWDAFDLWVCNVAKLRVGTADKIYTKHLPGFSIIEQEFKGMDEHSPEIYAK
jgi:FkbM family methyltransferase